MRIPVYLFTGFLESGKTQFIQELLEGDDFNGGERTLLLVFEEGEIKYDPSKFFGSNVFIENIKTPDKMNPRNLAWLQRKHRVERVIVEYNGMWLLDNLIENFPIDWEVAQEMTFFESGTFLNFNKNMRQLVYDKLKMAEIIVFNRGKREFLQKEEFHKIVRGANTRAVILYEYALGDVELDNIQDPLPFDLDADVITIKDDDFAIWYRDINEELEKYQDKNISLKGRVVIGDELNPGVFIFGRHIMTCCVDDISYGGVLCHRDDLESLKNGGWYQIRGHIKVKTAKEYGEKPGPVIYVDNIEKAEEANPEVATFY